MSRLPSIIIYTDGACSHNPGEGGWAAYLCYKTNDGTIHEKTLSGYKPMTTNNEMELTAVIMALNALKTPSDVIVHSDSAYVVNAFSKGWLISWSQNNWKTSSAKPVANKPLWNELLELSMIHKVRFEKVKGHSNDELNNLCDKLAREAIQNKR